MRLFFFCLLLSLFCIYAQRHRQQSRNRATTAPRTGGAKAASVDQSAPNVTVADAVDNSNQAQPMDGEVACPRACDAVQNPQQRAVEAFWNNNVILAEACACLALQLRRDDGIAEAVRYEAMHSPYMPSAYRQSHFTATRPQTPPPYVLQEYELLGPVPVGKLEVDADSTFVAYERSKLAAPLRSDDKRAAPGQGPAARTRTDVRQLQRAEFLRYQDPAAYLLALPSAGAAPRGKASASAAGGLPVFSEFAVDGVTGGWRRQKAGASGQLDVQFPDVNWQGLVNSMSSTAVLEFQGWVRTVTYAAAAGTYVLSCQGTHTAYVRNSNRTHLVAGDVYSGGGVDNGLADLSSGIGILGSSTVLPVLRSRVVGSLYLKAGVVGIVMPVRGVVKASVSCHIKLADWGASGPGAGAAAAASGTGGGAGRTASGHLDGISAGGSGVSLLPYPAKHVPELLEWEFAESAGGAAGNNRPKSTGMGLLMSDVFLLPIHNLMAEPLIISVDLELSDALTGFLSSVGASNRLPPYMTKNFNSSTLSIRPVTLESLSKRTRGGRNTADAEDDLRGPGPEHLFRSEAGLHAEEETIKIAPGQTMAVPLQLYRERVVGRDFRVGAAEHEPGLGRGGEEEEDQEGEYPPDGDEEDGAAEGDAAAADGAGDASREVGPDSPAEADPLFLPCSSSKGKGAAGGERAGSFVYYVVLSPSRGNQIKVPFEIGCRRRGESIMVSYLDHDGTVAQAALLFPLVGDAMAQKAGQQYSASTADLSAPPAPGSGAGGAPAAAPHWMDIAHREMRRRHQLQSAKAGAHNEPPPAAYNDRPCGLPYLHKDYPLYPGCYPALFTLHGSGSPARNQADAYKRKLGRGEPNTYSHTISSPATEYVFGVGGYFVVAPARFGAHNWETVGEKSALHATHAVSEILAQFSPFLPQMRASGHMIAGHSMGAHGALVAATANPALFSCASFASGWLRKETYGGGNEFQRWDMDEAHVEPRLKALLEANLAEFHPDRLVGNLQLLRYVHVRVGRNDATTPPWHSRRLVRLLSERFGAGSVAGIAEIGGGVSTVHEMGHAQPASQSRKLNSKFADRGRAAATPHVMHSSQPLDPSKLELANAVLDERAVVDKLRALFSSNLTQWPGAAESALEAQFSATERLFIEQQLVPRVILEELPDKEHWWWDSQAENDGGVLNDFSMRVLYNKCFAHSVLQQWGAWLVGSMHRDAGLPGAETGGAAARNDALSDVEAATDEPSQQLDLLSLVFNHSQHLSLLARGATGDDAHWLVHAEASHGGRSSAVSGRSKASAEAARLLAKEKALLKDSHAASDWTAREHMKREQRAKQHAEQAAGARAGDSDSDSGDGDTDGDQEGGGGGLHRAAVDAASAVPALSPASVQAAALGAHMCYGLLAVPSDRSSPAATSFQVAASSIATHTGSCGIQILQQQQSLAVASVTVDCFGEYPQSRERGASVARDGAKAHATSSGWSSYEEKSSAEALLAEELEQDAAAKRRNGLAVPLVTCSLRTQNVRRMRLFFNSVRNHSSEAAETVDCGPASAAARPVRSDLMPLGLHDLEVDGVRVREISEQALLECAGSVGSARPAACLYWNRALPMTAEGVRYMDLCIAGRGDAQRTSVCTDHPPNSLMEKTALAAGPIREVYSRPLVVIVGTLQNKKASADQRISSREFAAYLANSVYAAYDSAVTVMTDVEYLAFVAGLVANQYSERTQTGSAFTAGSAEANAEASANAHANARVQHLFPNIICIGGPQTNKVMRLVHEQQRHSRSRQQGADSEGRDEYLDQVLFGLQQQSDDVATVRARGASGRPGQQQPHREVTKHALLGNLPLQFVDSAEWSSRRQDRPRGAERDVADTTDGFGFRLAGGRAYTKKQHALLFAFPLQLVVRSSSSATSLYTAGALAVCIHSNDNEFVPLSRWLWPTVPPMVRAPLEVNSLDYVVLDEHALFSRGYGAVLATGIWDQRWRSEDETASGQSYSRQV